MIPRPDETTVQAMTEQTVERIAWRRRGRRRQYVGALAAGDAGIRLTGREVSSGLEVSLAIPREEIEGAHVSRTRAESLGGQRAVVIELADSDPILVCEVGVGPSHVHALARRLAAASAH